MDNTNEAETVIITAKRYQGLLACEEWLCFLEAAGVDNWEGYGFAQELREEAENEATP